MPDNRCVPVDVTVLPKVRSTQDFFSLDCFGRGSQILSGSKQQKLTPQFTNKWNQINKQYKCDNVSWETDVGGLIALHHQTKMAAMTMVK